MSRRPIGPFGRRRDMALLACGYVLFAVSGVLALLLIPSPSLKSQGGQAIVDVWAAFCVVGGISGATGLLWPLKLVELVGVILLGSASLTWTTSLILQAVVTSTAVPLTAAAIAGALTSVLAHRAMIVVRFR
jgi:hypothetical protein